MKSNLLILGVSAAILLPLCAQSAPVTGWSIGLNNAGLVSLTGADTASPTLGDGTAEDADNTAIWAAFPSVTLAVGEQLTLSGSVQMLNSVGLASAGDLANNFRFGIFDVNGSSDVNGWLGYYASAPNAATASGVRRRSSSAFYSQTGATLLYANSLVDTTKTIVDATYNFSFAYERTATGIKLTTTMSNPLGYEIAPLTFEDTGATTFTFNRVGFLAGGALNADSFQFNNIDVSLAVVPEPGTGMLALLGAALLVYRRSRHS